MFNASLIYKVIFYDDLKKNYNSLTDSSTAI